MVYGGRLQEKGEEISPFRLPIPVLVPAGEGRPAHVGHPGYPYICRFTGFYPLPLHLPHSGEGQVEALTDGLHIHLLVGRSALHGSHGSDEQFPSFVVHSTGCSAFCDGTEDVSLCAFTLKNVLIYF